MHPELSYLFFNYPRPNYDEICWAKSRCFNTEMPSDEDIAKAILLDAKNFFSNYPEICVSFGANCPEDLQKDFLRRM